MTGSCQFMKYFPVMHLVLLCRSYCDRGTLLFLYKVIFRGVINTFFINLDSSTICKLNRLYIFKHFDVKYVFFNLFGRNKELYFSDEGGLVLQLSRAKHFCPRAQA